MVYQIVNKISEVKSFALNGGQIYFSSLSKLSDISGNVLVETTKSLQEIKFENPYFFINDIEGNSYLINYEVLFLDNIFIKKVVNRNVILISRNARTEFFNLKEKEFKSFLEYKIFKFMVEGEVIVFNKNRIIYCYSLPSSNPIWQYDLSSLGTYKNLTNESCHYEVKYFIGVCEGKLIIQLSNATFLFLDIESGEQINILHLNEMLELPKPVFYEDAYPAHIDDNQLIWLSNQRLLNIDIDTFQARVIRDYFTAPRENQFRFMSNTYNDGMIYFVADYGWQYVTPSYVGVMDANTGEILWHQQLENTGGLPEAPQVSGDKLYVRTNNKVLHIFVKTEV